MQLERLTEEAGLPLRHLKELTERREELKSHAEWYAAVQALKAIVDVGGTAIVVGDRGNGKTMAAGAVILYGAHSGKQSLYLRCREVGMRLREAYDEGSRLTEREVVAEFVAPWLLVLDECQEKPDRDWESRSLTLIMDKRYGECRPTILIANAKKEALKDLFGASVIDRAREGGGVVPFTWRSFRE